MFKTFSINRMYQPLATKAHWFSHIDLWEQVVVLDEDRKATSEFWKEERRFCKDRIVFYDARSRTPVSSVFPLTKILFWRNISPFKGSSSFVLQGTIFVLKTSLSMLDIRNIAIIAHVDHGKTTLADSLLKQSDTFKDNGLEGETIMDSNELERERGITILAKNAAVFYKGTKINIVDTPGHADFGGEVERIMNLVDGVLLLVDAKEGPMPQTRFVLKKAIEAGHRIILVINKVDKPDARPDWVLNQTFDLFVTLGASDAQTDFPVVYASAKQGKAGLTEDLSQMTDIHPLFDTIINKIAAPNNDETGPLQVSVANIGYDNYKGKTAIGRVVRGIFRPGPVMWIDRDGKQTPAKITNIMGFLGMGRTEIQEAKAGDIVSFAGIPNVNIGETIAALEKPEALPVIKIEEPTVKMAFGVNTSPLGGGRAVYNLS